ncbi:hypothetical protein FJT64_023476 [Amphibalanus amphitrite]|uniref:Secreted protein n=1 Tax=Amphibalanus amphitrite TaxID=1232801 RepID=A0A6A4WM87_AMPAM|nr:hypothetical protein FJT64_023476 [Amphibalanus amphitrite]
MGSLRRRSGRPPPLPLLVLLLLVLPGEPGRDELDRVDDESADRSGHDDPGDDDRDGRRHGDDDAGRDHRPADAEHRHHADHRRELPDDSFVVGRYDRVLGIQRLQLHHDGAVSDFLAHPERQFGFWAGGDDHLDGTASGGDDGAAGLWRHRVHR